MTQIKWIKLNVDMFDDEKIKIIQAMPEGDAILLIWIKLILLAGKTNNGGYVYINESMPYTDEMLSIILNKPLTVIRLALETFTKLGMVETDEMGIYLINFEKHQSLDKFEKIREQNRIRQQRFREKKKVALCITQNNAIDKDKEIDKEIDKDKEIYNNMRIQNMNARVFEQEFDELWQLYPNKKSKKDALRHYVRARKKGIAKETIKNGLLNYLDFIKKENIKPKYIKYGSTWFNQECWNDDYTSNRKMTTKDFEGIIDFNEFEEI